MEESLRLVRPQKHIFKEMQEEKSDERRISKNKEESGSHGTYIELRANSPV